MTQVMTAFAFFVLVTVGLGGVLLALFMPHLSDHARLRRRNLALGMSGGVEHRGDDRTAGSTRQMRRSVEDALRDMEQAGQRRPRWHLSPAARLQEAGLNWSPLTHHAICLAIALCVGAALWAGLGAGVVISIGVGVCAGLWLPNLYVGREIKRRRLAFTTAFPDAVDIIVRGVRSGIPLSDCLHIVATEAQPPVSTEFRTTVDDLAIGLAVEEAVQRMAARVRLEEARYFSIVLTIQSRSGGNLSEALANLSVVLRDRAKMRGRIRAMSSEARTSAAIIGALPPLVCFLVFLTSPDYVGLLFSTFAGNMVLAASAVWMLFGIGIMRQMINFDF